MKSIIPLLIICLLTGSCKKAKFESLRLDSSDCIQNKIEEFLKLPKNSRPASVTEYLYKGDLVYYIVSSCCDQYNPVYNSNCEYLGAPNGGITGGGDGKLPDFFANAINKRVIWENK